MPSYSKRSILLLAAAVLAACGGSQKAPPPPLPSIALPSGAQLKPFSSTPTSPRPSAMVALGGQVYVALANLDASFNPGGPGLIVGVVPSTGAQSIADLGGEQCTNVGFLGTDGAGIFASCTGSYADLSGRQIVEVDPVAGAVTRRVAASALPSAFQPGPIAVAATKIWVGATGFAGASLISIDRATFALVDGGDAAHPPIQVPCTSPNNKFFAVGGLLVVVGDLFALCEAKDGFIARFDAATGALKGSPQIVGGVPVALALTGDGRIAVADSVSSEIALVTAAESGLSIARSAIPSSTDLEDVAARNQFVYVVNSSAKTVVKVDISNGFQIVDSRSVASAPSSNPNRIVLVADDVAMVSDYETGKLISVRFDVPAM